MARLECVRPVNFYDGLFATVFGASAALLSILLTTRLILAAQERSWRRRPETKTPKRQRIRAAFISKAWNLAISILFFLFPPISKRCFNTFHCTQMGDESYMCVTAACNLV